jgi:glycosyltransferase involved in cell wall biosynthesis
VRSGLIERRFDYARLKRMPAPVLSVLMAVRNMEEWLPTTLDSLRTQTRTDFEVVVVDDGSTDATSAMLDAATDLPLRVVRAEGIGLGAARNVALEHATAPLLAVLDGDDLWLPHYVQKVVDRLETDPDIAIVSPEVFVAVEQTVTSDRYYADGHPLQFFEDDQLEHLADMNFVVPLSTYRREVIDTIGHYDPRPGAIEDWDLWIRAVQAGFRIGHITEPCGVYRFRTGSITTDRIKLIRGRIDILERLAASDGPGSARARQSLAVQRLQLHIAKGKEALTLGDLSVARASFLAVARDHGGTWRQRVGSLVVAGVPRLGRTVLSRRSELPPAPLSPRDVRRNRE